MKKILTGILLSIIALSFSACSLIPPIDIGQDPLGLTGKKVEATVNSGAALTTQTKTATGSITASFNNVDKGSAPNPAQILAKLNIQNTVTIVAADGNYPDSIAMEVAMNGVLSEPSGTPFTASGKIADISLTKDAGCTTGAASCTYTVVASATPALLTFSGNAISIILGGTEPNEVTVSVALTVTGLPSDLADGSTITITLAGEGASAKL